MESDINAADRGEQISLMEPLLIADGSRHRGRLTDLALDLTQKSAGFRRSLPPALLVSLADLVRAMNCYYSNLIEGHDTHPIDIERALKNDYSQDARKRDLQLEARAHIAVQRWIDSALRCASHCRHTLHRGGCRDCFPTDPHNAAQTSAHPDPHGYPIANQNPKAIALESIFVIVDLEATASMTAGYAMSRADLVIIPAQGSHLDATEAVKAIKLAKAQEKAFQKKIPLAILFTRTSAIRPRTLQSIESEFAENKVPMFGTQIHEREAYRAVFAFGGTLAGLDPKQLANLPMARLNAEAFATEVIQIMKAAAPLRQNYSPGTRRSQSWMLR